MAKAPKYDHTSNKALAAANPDMRWQFYNRHFSSWQTIRSGGAPSFLPFIQYRPTPTGINIDKAHKRITHTTADIFASTGLRGSTPQEPKPDLDTKRSFERIANVLSVLHKNGVITGEARQAAMEYMRFDTSLNQREKILRDIKAEV